MGTKDKGQRLKEKGYKVWPSDKSGGMVGNEYIPKDVEKNCYRKPPKFPLCLAVSLNKKGFLKLK